MRRMSRGRRLSAPRADGGVLIDPDWSAIPELIESNRAASATSYNAVTIASQSLASLATQARARLLDEAFAYTSTYRNASRPTSDRILLAGHQPELFHVGVWMKNFVLGGLARETGATAVNLVIDGDTIKSPSIRVPTGTLEEPRAESVPFDAAADEIPWEERGGVDAALFESFGRRAAEAIRPFIARPMIERIWPKIVEATKRTGRIGLGIAQARHALEGEWGLDTLELPQGRVCDMPEFRLFAWHLLTELPRFVEIHNRTLVEYRREENIRSTHHPVPALEKQGEWLEAPLWLWTTDSPYRRRPLVRRVGDEIEVTDRVNVTFRLPATGGDAPSKSVEILAEQAKCGVKIRSRALITTMYARLVLSDLFIHGIGGGKYDELTDLLIERFFQIKPPGYVVATATRRLPIAHGTAPNQFATPPFDEPTVRHKLWELTHHPERSIDVAAMPAGESQDRARRMIAEKQAIVAASGYALPSGASQERRFFNARFGARERCHAIRALNESLQEFVAPQREAWTARQAVAQQAERAYAIIGSREYSAYLFPENDLRNFLLAISARER
jgi:hypothetical protein